MLAVGTGLKRFDFFRYFFYYFNGILQGNETVIFFLFWHFSLKYNVSIINIIHISMLNRLNVFFSHFSCFFSCI